MLLCLLFYEMLLYNICTHARAQIYTHTFACIHGLSFSKKKKNIYTNVYRAFLSLISSKLIYQAVIRILKFKSHLAAHSLLSVFRFLQSGTTNVSRARVARGRSLIKLLKDFRRRPKRGLALRFVDSGRTSGSTSRSISLPPSLLLPRRPSYSFCRLFARHPTLRILLELHSQFPRSSSR